MPGRQLFIVNDSSRARGGATGLALLSARRLAARGWQVTLICGDAGHAADFAGSGIEILALGQQPLLSRPRGQALRDGIHNAAARDFLARIVAERDDPGAVWHLHGWAQIFSPAVFQALAPVARRVAVHAHDMFLACPNGTYMDYRRGEICTRRPLSAACLATNCDKRSYAQKLWRVARGAGLRRQFGRGDWGAVLPIHPGQLPGLERGGIDAGRMRVIRNPAEPLMPPSQDTDRGFLAYLGRLEPDKGVPELLAAAGRVGARLKLIGAGSLEGAARAQGHEVTGWQDRAGIAAHLAGARALVMPSRHPEPFALVLPEALLSGLPVLVSDTAMMAPEITALGVGRAFDAGSPRDFDAALRWIADCPEGELAAMRQAAPAAARRLALSETAWLDALEAVYSALAGAAPSGAAAREAPSVRTCSG